NSMGDLTTPGELVRHLKNTLWPFLETVVTEVEEQDEIIEDLVQGATDILHPETARVFGMVIVTGLALAKSLEEARPGDSAVKKAIEQFRGFCKTASDTLEEITIPEDDAASGEDEDDDDDEGNDDDEEEDDDAAQQ